MKTILKKPPRIFTVGAKQNIQIQDVGEIHLKPDEQVTFVTESGKNYDLAAKSWGFYATPSVNGRLRNEGFKTVLVKNELGRFYVMIVEIDKISEFEKYLEQEANFIVEWLDEK